jgi:hypothetical protein
MIEKEKEIWLRKVGISGKPDKLINERIEIK